jgi:CheY-like chemotaxis protein
MSSPLLLQSMRAGRQRLTANSFDKSQSLAHDMGCVRKAAIMHVEISDRDPRLRSVLILEDEGLVSMMIEAIVRELGCEDIHSFPDAAAALAFLADRDVDCAILDVQVRDGDTSHIADMLERRGIPFLFSTGSGTDGLADRHRQRPLITKPFADDDLKLLVLNTVAAARAGFSAQPANRARLGVERTFPD